MSICDPWVYDQMVREECKKTSNGAALRKANDKLNQEREKHLELQVKYQELRFEILSEEYFRKQHPAAKDAWEKYQTVLRLVKK